jgi:DNA polymerase-3 subunit delta'
MNTVYPWQQEQWRNVMERLGAANLPHALLLAGPGGLGKNRFAALLAQTVLCETGIAAGQACGHCRSCLLYAADSHPDHRLVAPAEPGKTIAVDQVREAGRYLSQTAQYGGYKVLIVSPADQMNLNAANSLLKTLEEPSAGSLILLVSDRPGRLPATVLSRCQRLNFTPPPRQQAQHWLQEQIGPGQDPALLLSLAEGAPLRALQLVEDDVLAARLEVMNGLEALAGGKGNFSNVAERFLKIGVQETLYWMYNWTADMIRYLSSGSEGNMVNRDLGASLAALAHTAGLEGVHGYLRRLDEALRLAERQLNQQLLMEDILMTWQELFLQARKPGAKRSG